MDIKSANNELGKRIRELLQDKSMSMRHLSKLTDIDTATISRIINGKRKANLNHLENFAKGLEVPVVDLIEAAGYRSKDNEEENRTGVEEELKYTKKLLAAYQIEEERLTMENIEQELKVHQEYSQTDEGRRMIITSFKEKLKKSWLCKFVCSAIGRHVPSISSAKGYKNRGYTFGWSFDLFYFDD